MLPIVAIGKVNQTCFNCFLPDDDSNLEDIFDTIRNIMKQNKGQGQNQGHGQNQGNGKGHRQT